MPGVTRRGFLATSVSTAAGVAGIGALAAAAAPHMRGTTVVPTTTPATGESLVAYVRKGGGGELSLMAGTREISLHDPDLVRRLHAAASGSQPQAAPPSMFVR